MGIRWFRNLPLKVGAILVAGLSMLIFYGAVEANPLSHSTASTSGNTTQGSTSPSSTLPTPQTASGFAQGQTVPQQQRAPLPRMRRSRGS